jgi:hypothetical protein
MNLNMLTQLCKVITCLTICFCPSLSVGANSGGSGYAEASNADDPFPCCSGRGSVAGNPPYQYEADWFAVDGYFTFVPGAPSNPSIPVTGSGHVGFFGLSEFDFFANAPETGSFAFVLVYPAGQNPPGATPYMPSQEPDPDYSPEEVGSTISVPPGASKADVGTGPTVANETTGAYLTTTDITLPITERFGNEALVWLHNQKYETELASVSWNPAYVFLSDNRFTHFKIPDALPGGDSQFTLVFNLGMTQTVSAGQEFAFTDFVSGGVGAFVLTGLEGDSSLVSGQPFPYFYGVRFADIGTASIAHGPLLPGDLTMNGVVNENDFLELQKHFGSATELPVDTNNDGFVDAADYVMWRKVHESSPNSSAAPEPDSVIIAVSLFMSLIHGRRMRPAWSPFYL